VKKICGFVKNIAEKCEFCGKQQVQLSMVLHFTQAVVKIITNP
jgi:hypothetical protein